MWLLFKMYTEISWGQRHVLLQGKHTGELDLFSLVTNVTIACR